MLFNIRNFLAFQVIEVVITYSVDDIQSTILALNQRLSPQKSSKETVTSLIQQSIGSWTTHWYDQFQFYMTGIL